MKKYKVVLTKQGERFYLPHSKEVFDLVLGKEFEAVNEKKAEDKMYKFIAEKLGSSHDYFFKLKELV